MSEIDTYGTSSLVCPYCGHANEPDSEHYDYMTRGNYLYECYKCEKKFISEIEFDPVYYSKKIPNLTAEETTIVEKLMGEKNLKSIEKHLRRSLERKGCIERFHVFVGDGDDIKDSWRLTEIGKLAMEGVSDD